MTAPPAAVTREHGHAYDIFILVLTIVSLGVMVALLLPLDDATLEVLRFYDNLICVIFLADFAINITGSHPRSEYFIRQRGWLDLLGSIPTFGGVFRYAGILRLARLSRLGRIAKLLGGKGKTELISDVVHNRGQYALFLTILLAIMVLTICSTLVLQFESRSPDANIDTGGEALWWAVVTITTVGYGDFYPVTTLGRMTAVFVMLSGVGIIGALASILASVLVTSDTGADEEVETDADTAAESQVAITGTDTPAAMDLAETRSELTQTRTELAATRQELAALRDLILRDRGGSPA
jgi:voltage-gated potassium channel